MDHLPDDVLVLVMSHLDITDLLSCRVACKRFAQLALHPDAWRRRCLNEYFNPDEFMDASYCPVLRLAPCLDLIDITLPSPNTCHSLFTAPCPARRLRISLTKKGGAAYAALLIRHQRELGRLRGVELYLEAYISKADSAVLFETLVSTPDLQYIKIRPDEDLDFSPRSLHPTTAASLKYFRCPLGPSLELFFNSILKQHAATLEAVYVVCHEYEVPPSPSTTALLLAQLPNLVELRCRIFPGMEAAATCASLRTLRLEVVPNSSDEAVAAATALLRRARQVLTVHLVHMYWDWDEDSPVGLELMRALSGRSSLEVLRICLFWTFSVDRLPLQYLHELRHILPSLPALRKLDLEAFKRDVIFAELGEFLAGKPSLQVESGS